VRRTLVSVTIAALVMVACAADDPSEPEVLLDLGDALRGDTVGLIAVEDDDTRAVEWIDRRSGEIRRLDLDAGDATVETVATVPVSTDGEQRGLLGQVDIDGRRFASWTQPGTNEIVVGEIVDGAPANVVWSGGEAGGGAIGGVLDDLDGRILLGLGRNTDWDADTRVGGAILSIDPDGSPDDAPSELAVGFTNPWAFTATESGEVWFADNAAGPDPDDPDIDDRERIGRADRVDNRNDVPRITEPGRAPTAMVELPDGRIGICGFLDNELRAYEIVDTDAGERTGLERAGTIMPCLTGAAVFADGTIVTAAQTGDGEALLVLRA
jgi:hypothetical protein